MSLDFSPLITWTLWAVNLMVTNVVTIFWNIYRSLPDTAQIVLPFVFIGLIVTWVTLTSRQFKTSLRKFFRSLLRF